ncbi:MAG: anti-sigma factor [Dermatophilaceae bacterium]|nr:zf-HC2 domain-containing protein [Intrasporangiaceae bacterium]
MKQSLRQMITCHWSARRIQRYLDADPAAPLTPGEIARLEAHLAECEKCAQVSEEHRVLHRALSLWPGAPTPDEQTVERLQSFLTELTEEPRS